MRITIWENDLVEEPDAIVTSYVKEHFTHFDVNFLSGLSRRDPQDIIDSINGTNAVVANINHIDASQVRGLAALFGKRIFGHVCGKDLDRFIFLSSFPKESAEEVAEACRTPWTEEADDARNGLTGILYRCEVMFIDPSGEGHDGYKLETTGWANRDFDIIELEYGNKTDLHA